MGQMTGARATIVAIVSLVVGGGLAVPPAATGAGGGEVSAFTGRVIVVVKTPKLRAPSPDGLSEARRARLGRARDVLAAVIRRHGLRVEGRIPEIGMIVADPGPESLAALRTELGRDPRVQSVTPERRAELRLAPNDFAFGIRDPNAPRSDWMQWNLRRYGAVRAWNLSRGLGAEVAVVDTGSYGAHPDLHPRIVGSASFQSGSPTSDPDGHGTHTAGLACAQSNNGYGIASLGFRCNLFIERVALTCSAVANAIVAAANRGSDAISISLGGCDTSLNDALQYAWGSGSIPVAAGANVPEPNPATNHPAQYVQPKGSGPNLAFGRGLVVTSAKHNGTRSGFAQRTTGVSVAAFGSATDKLSGGRQGILSTWPPQLPPPGGDTIMPPVRTTLDGDNRFAYLVGTSMATPQAAGLVALIRSVRPRMPAAKVVRLIKLTADGRGSYGRGLGWGIIDAHAAVAAALGKDITAPRSRARWAWVAKGPRGRAARRRGRRLITVRIKRFDRKRPALPRSGIKAVNLVASVNGRPFRRVGKTRGVRVRFLGRPGRRYRFYTRAVDRAGNREPVPRKPEVFLRVR
jgi:serine protease